MEPTNEENFSPNDSLQVMADMIEKVQNDKLRKLAKQRANFKKSTAFLIAAGVMLVAIWYFTTGVNSYFWPMWPLIVFAFSIVVQYLEAYGGTSFFSEEKEYEKLKAERKNKS